MHALQHMQACFVSIASVDTCIVHIAASGLLYLTAIVV
jgi:hypothetical protein